MVITFISRYYLNIFNIPIFPFCNGEDEEVEEMPFVSASLIGGEFIDLDFDGRYIYSSNPSFGLVIFEGVEGGGIEIIGTLPPHGDSGRLIYQENLVYLSHHGDGILTIDVEDRKAPSLVSQIESKGYLSSLSIDGEHLFATSSDMEIEVFSIDEADAPLPISVPELYGSLTSLAVPQIYAFVSSGDYGVRIIDVSEPSSPAEIAYIDTPGFATHVAVGAGYIFLADMGEGVRIINIVTPESPVDDGYIQNSDAGPLLIKGDNLYLCSGEGTISVYNIQTPTTPVLSGEISTGGDCEGLDLTENYIDVAGGVEGIFTIDASNLTTLLEWGRYHHWGNVLHLASSDSSLFVAMEDEGIVSLDITDPHEPVELATLQVPGSPVSFFSIPVTSISQPGKGG